MNTESEIAILTNRLYNAVLDCPHHRTKSFLVLKQDILQNNPEDTKKQLRQRLDREIRKIFKEVYGRKI